MRPSLHCKLALPRFLLRLAAVDVDQLLDKLAAARLSMVILDACRNNPFERRFRGGGQGLAQINAPTGTLIAYATAPGKVASDGDGRNGLYTQELLTAMDTPGIKVEDVFKRVRANVVRKSGDAQTPWESSSLTGDFYFIFQGPTTVEVNQAPQSPEESLWAQLDVSRPCEYQAYLDHYPQGRYAGLARQRLKACGNAVAPAATKPPPATSVTAKPEDAETALWNEVKASGAREYLDAYLKQYAKGKYAALARIELKKLDDQDKRQKAQEEAERKAEQARIEAERRNAAEREQQDALRAEQQSWEQAKIADSLAAYAGYLQSYPRGRYATLAQAAQQKMQREANERQKREAAQRQQQAERQRIAEERARREAEKAAAEMRPGKAFKDCADCPEMVMIPAGSFEMGSNNGDSDEKPVHSVRIARPFAIGKTEVTQGQWRAVMGSAPSHFSNCGDDCPVEQVRRNDAQDYVKKLSQKTGKSYRLPSEAEWEYACRAGGQHTYCGSESIDSVAWYGGNSGGKTHAVAGKQTNAWGLYDMSGNVWEWVQDCKRPNYNGAPSDGSAWESGQCVGRVLRGRAWNFITSSFARAGNRYVNPPDARSSYDGFRPARTLP